MTLTSVVSVNKKGFLKYVNGKRKSKENTGLVVDADHRLKSKDEENMKLGENRGVLKQKAESEAKKELGKLKTQVENKPNV